ncbi:thiol reductant ABC exporter subunit CydD [Streptomyces longispororuber]|uniref:thiol reductant ABC exporter subunit CydD n=1 Tax=Streptomyces longispororuber TaxID=68230 RepID=UPI0036FCFC8D
MKPTERRLLTLVPRRAQGTLAACAVAQACLIVLQADLLARMIAHRDLGPLPWLAAVAAVRGALTWTVQARAARVAARVKTGLRAELLDRPGPAGGRITLVTRGLDALDPFFTGYLPSLSAAVATPLLVLVRLAVADWRSALVVLVTLPLIPVFGALVGLRTAELTRRQWAVLHRIGAHFHDVLAGLPTLRAHARTRHQSEVLTGLAREHRRATVGALRVAFLSSLVLELVAALSVALVAVPVGLRLLNGSLALSTALVVLLLTPEAFLPLRALGARFHASAEGVAAAEQAFEVLDAPLPAPARPGRTPVRPGRTPVRPGRAPVRSANGPHIVFENVAYRYPGSAEAAVSGFDLEIRPGERVALAGPSGVGKSTVLRLLLGLLDPCEGRLVVDGRDLRDLDLAPWRASLAWVPQRPHLFAVSVADNIRLGRPDATAQEVHAAARAAHADGFVKALPTGYATVLGDRGTGLSAGQRQRLALARAHLQDAPLLLLDEPTARLDLASEAALLTGVGGLLTDRTALMVAHRPALLALADRTVHLPPGRRAASAPRNERKSA